MDNIAKRDANTCTQRTVCRQTARGKLWAGLTVRKWLVQKPTPAMAVSKSDESNHSAEAFFERESRRISALSASDGSVVDYRGDNGYGELGFDSGEGA